MNKKQGILIGIALVLLFTSIALTTSSASPDVIIHAFDQNPAGSDEGNEWVTLQNPSNESVEIGNWTLENGDGGSERIDHTTIPKAAPRYVPAINERATRTYIQMRKSLYLVDKSDAFFVSTSPIFPSHLHSIVNS